MAVLLAVTPYRSRYCCPAPHDGNIEAIPTYAPDLVDPNVFLLPVREGFRVLARDGSCGGVL